MKQCLQEAELLNVQYLAFMPEIERDKILQWYDVEFGRVNDALDEALSHLNERESEETSQVACTQAVGWSKKTEFIMRSPSWIRAARSGPG